MKFTNLAAFESALVLSQCEEKGTLGYVIARNRRKIADELKDYLKYRDDQLTSYGHDEGDGKVSFTKEGNARFREAMAEVDAIEIEIPILAVTEDIFTSGTLDSKQMYALDWMVKRDGD